MDGSGPGLRARKAYVCAILWVPSGRVPIATACCMLRVSRGCRGVAQSEKD